jgi:hypothetical protein
VAVVGDGEVAQPKKVLSLEDAGDLGSGLLRLDCSIGVADVVSGTSLVVLFGPRLSCGGGDLRANMDMVLVLVLMMVVRLSWCDDSGEPGIEYRSSSSYGADS